MDTAYTIKRSPKRKKLTITVERDRSVVVHAPESTSEETIRKVVKSKRQWIYEKTKHAQKYDKKTPSARQGIGERRIRALSRSRVPDRNYLD